MNIWHTLALLSSIYILNIFSFNDETITKNKMRFGIKNQSQHNIKLNLMKYKNKKTYNSI